MAFPVRLVFTDLCAYVRTSAEEMMVLLVDARSPTEAQEAVGMHRHEPVLAVPVQHLSSDPANRSPDRLVPELGGDALAVFALDREELRLSSPSPLDVASQACTSAVPLSCVDEKTLNWIAAMNQLGFGKDNLVPAALGDLGAGPVASRVKISGGRVTCERVIRMNGQYRQFEFKSAPAAQPVGHRRALGDLVAVEFTMPSVEENGGPQITSSSGQGVFILAPAAGSRVNLLVGNMTLEPGQLFSGGSEATHFRWFYELFQSPPPLMERVIPYGAALGPLSSGGRICPATQVE